MSTIAGTEAEAAVAVAVIGGVAAGLSAAAVLSPPAPESWPSTPESPATRRLKDM